MELVANICQVVIAAGVFNVWILRPNKPTPWRGSGAGNMKEEFKAYGLPDWTVTAVGAAKLLLGALLVVGIWYEPVAAPSAAAMALLMTGAILMHARVKDPLKKSLPAFTMLVLSVIVLLVHW